MTTEAEWEKLKEENARLRAALAIAKEYISEKDTEIARLRAALEDIANAEYLEINGIDGFDEPFTQWESDSEMIERLITIALYALREKSNE